MNEANVLRVGIASDADIRARVFAIAKGEIKPLRTDPKVWVRSMSELKSLLSDNNHQLINAMQKVPEASVSDLAEMTQQGRTCVSRSLNQLATLGMVTLERKGRHVRPRLQYDRIELRL